MLRPRIFVSAVTSELQTARQLVASTLSALGYEPIWQEIFESSAGDLRSMLQRKIDSCGAVIQIVGDAYGAEPPQPDEQFGRVSYTQYEALYARSKNKPVYYLFAKPDFPIDHPVASVDVPRSEQQSDVDDATRRRELQSTYREKIRQEGSIRYWVSSKSEIKNTIYEMRRELDRLRRVTRLFMSAILVGLIMVGAGVTWIAWRQPDQIKQSVQTATTNAVKTATPDIAAAVEDKLDDPELLRGRLRMSVNRQFEEEKSSISLREPAQYQEALRRLEQNRKLTFEQIDALIESIQAGLAAGNMPPEFPELARLLKGDPKAAIEYIKRLAPSILERVDTRTVDTHDKNRADLSLLLDGVRVAIVNGDYAFAIEQTQEILKRDPKFAEAHYQRYLAEHELGDRAIVAAGAFSARKHFETAEQSAATAYSLEPKQRQYERAVMAAAHARGHLWRRFLNKEKALQAYEDAYELARGLAATNPDDVQAQRDLATSNGYLGDLQLQNRNTDEALEYYRQMLNITLRLAAIAPDNREIQRDLMLAYGNLGTACLSDGQVQQSLDYYDKSFQYAKQLVARQPEETQAQLDLSDAYGRLGEAYQILRHSEKALVSYEQRLQICKQIASLDPESPHAQRALYNSYSDLGSFHLKSADAASALEEFDRGLEIVVGLVKRNPGNFEALLQLAFAYRNVGDAHSAAKNYLLAISEYENAVAVINYTINGGALGSAIAAAKGRAIVTGHTRFRIPFQLDAETIESLGAREIQLYLSTDRGETWQHYQSVGVNANRFDFKTETDGEFWFAVRTLDSQNKFHPEAFRPGLKVIVDATSQPLTEFERLDSDLKVRLNTCRKAIDLEHAAELPADALQPANADLKPYKPPQYDLFPDQ